eukprot:6480815-Amphidinium_carterae.1
MSVPANFPTHVAGATAVGPPLPMVQKGLLPHPACDSCNAAHVARGTNVQYQPLTGRWVFLRFVQLQVATMSLCCRLIRVLAAEQAAQ